MENLTTSDTGKYWCAVLMPGDYKSPEVELNITKGNPEKEGTCKMVGYVGHNITFQCKYEKSDEGKTKYVCKNETGGCNKRIYDNTTGGFFIPNLTKEDAGIYWCIVEDVSPPNVSVARFKVIQLDVNTAGPPDAVSEDSHTPLALRSTPCFPPKPTTSSKESSVTSPQIGSAVVLSLSLPVLVVIVGMAVFICIRCRKNRDHEDHDYEEIPYTNGSASGIDTVYAKAELQPTTPCTDPTYSSAQLPTSAGDNPTYSTAQLPLSPDDDPAHSGVQLPPSPDDDPAYSSAQLPLSPGNNPTYSTAQLPLSPGDNPTYSTAQLPLSPGDNPPYSTAQLPLSPGDNPTYSTAQLPLSQLPLTLGNNPAYSTVPQDDSENCSHVSVMKDLSSDDDSRTCVTVKCKYQDVDKDKSKYVCKNEVDGCKRKIRTGRKDQWWNSRKFSLYDNTTGRFFLVSISNLTKEDAGIYWCAVDEPFYNGCQVTVEKFEVIQLDVQTAAAAGPMLVLSLCLAMVVVIAGTAVFICITCRCRKNRAGGWNTLLLCLSLYPLLFTKAHADCHDKEIKDANISSSTSNTVYSEAQLPTNPCTIQLPTSPSSGPTQPLLPEGPNYASVTFQKYPHSNNDLNTP
ncbi:hypothetical protein ACEWY4_017385 [Coilia grayii]|uniref:Immunoglobulin domain-containing protein n=1 Tax=Coilia grayii TaxID=363190 RepID=A0ABD1JHV8_9TELE